MVNIAIPNIAGQLQNLIQGDAQAASTSGLRNPILWTSLKRQFDAGARRNTTGLLTTPEQASFAVKQVGSPQTRVNAAKSASQLIANPIAMSLNPRSVRFEQPKRISRVDGVGGTRFHHFVNENGEDNDILTMTFQGNTGNIDRRGSLSSPERLPGSLTRGSAIDQKELAQQDTGAIKKLLVWHNLYLLTREPKFFYDTFTGQLIENRFYLTYLSALFPLQIRFTGHFDKVLDWEESATKPGSRDYNMVFVAEQSDPPLSEFIYQLGQYLTAAQPQLVGSVINTLGA